jgi:type IV pilus assembly protein PilY1
MQICVEVHKDESSPRHPYGVDGEAEIISIDVNNDGTLNYLDGDKAYAYFGLRRGGSAVYALDISNPDSPSFMWKIEGGSGNFNELALSFSKPRAIKVAYGSGNQKLALMFGGGYHGGYDGSGNKIGKDIGSAPDTPNQGNAIFMVDALTGALIWKATHADAISHTSQEFTHPLLIDSVPSTVEVMDSNADGLTDRAYVGDSGGTLWRIDFPASITTDNRASAWQIIPLAKLDDASAAGDRRFFHKPDIVLTLYNGTFFDAILIGSGDRADPLNTTPNNWFFMIKDFNAFAIPDPDTWNALTIASIPDITNDCLTSGCTSNILNGWRLNMAANGEKVLAPSVTIQGEIFFTSYLPEDDSISNCEANPGSGRLYTVSLFDGSPTRNRNTYDDDGNIDPSTQNDRFNALNAKSIPSQVVPLSSSKILLPDLTVEDRDDKVWKAGWITRGINIQ